MGQYDWVTDEMFESKLEEILSRMTGADLLAIPGVHEVVAEQLNNDILSELEEEREVSKG